jgi:hypothetical protein
MNEMMRIHFKQSETVVVNDKTLILKDPGAGWYFLNLDASITSAIEMLSKNPEWQAKAKEGKFSNILLVKLLPDFGQLIFKWLSAATGEPIDYFRELPPGVLLRLCNIGADVMDVEGLVDFFESVPAKIAGRVKSAKTSSPH